jgi:hypothetical protein
MKPCPATCDNPTESERQGVGRRTFFQTKETRAVGKPIQHGQNGKVGLENALQLSKNIANLKTSMSWLAADSEGEAEAILSAFDLPTKWIVDPDDRAQWLDYSLAVLDQCTKALAKAKAKQRRARKL